MAGASGRHDVAAQHFERASALDTGNVTYLHNHGEALRQMGRALDASVLFRKAINLEPRFLAAYHSLITMLREAHTGACARADHPAAQQLAGELAVLLGNQGNALGDAGRLDEACSSYREAIRFAPDYALAMSNLGNALRMNGCITEAELICRRATQIDARFAGAWNNLGNALVEQARFDEAGACFDQALRLEPGSIIAAHNQGSGRLFNLLFSADHGHDEILQRHLDWGKAFPLPMLTNAPRVRRRNRRPRIAYLSADFRRHAMLHFLEPLLEHHDRNRVEITCYAQGLHGSIRDEHTERLMRYGHNWVWVHELDDDALAQRIASDGVDILIDCLGHTNGTRLGALASKPAPLMMSWLGYLFTTGLPAMDYRLTDEWVDPPGSHDVHEHENPLRIPGGMMAYRPHARYPDVSPPRCERAGHITFGSLNNIQKFNITTARLWAQALNAVPDSRLLLQSKALVDLGTLGRVRGLFEALGITARRLDLRPAGADFLATYAEIDIALDTFPYGGGATTCDALWMGVPVITLPSDRPCGRLTSSILHQIGHPEWIAHNVASYARIAEELANNVARLKSTRVALRPSMARSALCDEAGFVRRFETTCLSAFEGR